MTHPDPLSLRGNGGQKNFRRRAVRVLLQKMMLNSPDMVEAKLVSQSTLFERIVVDEALCFP